MSSSNSILGRIHSAAFQSLRCGQPKRHRATHRPEWHGFRGCGYPENTSRTVPCRLAFLHEASSARQHSIDKTEPHMSAHWPVPRKSPRARSHWPSRLTPERRIVFQWHSVWCRRHDTDTTQWMHPPHCTEYLVPVGSPVMIHQPPGQACTLSPISVLDA